MLSETIGVGAGERREVVESVIEGAAAAHLQTPIVEAAELDTATQKVRAIAGMRDDVDCPTERGDSIVKRVGAAKYLDVAGTKQIEVLRLTDAVGSRER
jgi:hypothetical protein